MVDVYYDKDADLKFLEGKTIGMVGYGSQGHAHALNLKDNGQDVVVGLYPESKSRAVASASGGRRIFWRFDNHCTRPLQNAQHGQAPGAEVLSHPRISRHPTRRAPLASHPASRSQPLRRTPWRHRQERSTRRRT